MSDATVRTSASRSQIRKFLRDLPGMLSGRLPDRYGIRRAATAKLIHAAMEDIQRDYEAKSKGGAGADHSIWEPLHPYTIRARSKKRGESGKPGTPGLSAEEYKQISALKRNIYQEEYRRLRNGGVEKKEAQKQAAIISRFLSKSILDSRKGAGGKGQEGRGVPPEDMLILVDSGDLLKSASAGRVAGTGLSATYDPPEGQEVHLRPGNVAVDSNVDYGDSHMRDGKGSETGGFRPARPWKYPHGVPPEWVQKWARVFSEAVAECIPEVLARLT